MSHYTQNNTRGKETENPAVKETVEDASWKAGDRTDKPQKGQFSNRTFQKSALQLCAKLRINVCLSPCSTFAQTAKKAGVLP